MNSFLHVIQQCQIHGGWIVIMIVSLHVRVVIIHESDTPRRFLNSKIWNFLDMLGQAISSCLGQHPETFNSLSLSQHFGRLYNYNQLIWLMSKSACLEPSLSLVQLLRSTTIFMRIRASKKEVPFVFEQPKGRLKIPLCLLAKRSQFRWALV